MQIPWKGLVAAGLVGGMLGAAAILPGDRTVIPILGVGIASVGLALDSRIRGAYSRYVIRNTALWAGFYGLISLKYGVDLESASVVTGICLGGGMLAIALIRSLKPQNAFNGHIRKIVRFISDKVRFRNADGTNDQSSMLRSVAKFGTASLS